MDFFLLENCGGRLFWFSIRGKKVIFLQSGQNKRAFKKEKPAQHNQIWLAARALTCREHRSGRCAGAPGSWACASPDGSTKVRWCGAGVRRTPDPGRSRRAEGSLIPMRPSRRTDARPETHAGNSCSFSACGQNPKVEKLLWAKAELPLRRHRNALNS